MASPLKYRENAAELRQLADQMRWAERRDHLLHLAEHFAELADLKSNVSGTLAVASDAA